ncbi:MAG: RNA methyltransferase [Alphaproteobacteria bacterium]|jgi:tRNA/rRNA methyltransferase|nr:RNA methyltransferase [Alphaproteobacteria bacterium]
MPTPFAPTVILVRPQLPENGGAVARVMANFGLKKLHLVAPLFSPLDPKALAMAAGADDVLENALIFESLEEAIADLLYVYGTCAVERLMVKKYVPVREAMPEIAASDGVGIVFGPERTGLNNDELAKFRAILHVPVDETFSSLNLAQSVAITAYEWFQTQAVFKGKLHLGDTVPATHNQIQGFLTALEQSLDAAHFWRIDHKKPIMWRNLQNIFTRMDLTEQEVRTLHGMIQSLKATATTT